MPMSPLPSALLSHMIAINNVPPPPLRNIPRLKMPKHINYGQLNALCHIRGLQQGWSSYNIVSAHSAFMKQYSKIFLHKKPRLPKLFIQEQKRKAIEGTEESQCQPPDDSHNIAVHIKKAHGGHTLHEPKRSSEKLLEFLEIVKKLPVHRTPYEHKTVWKILKTVPDLTSQLSEKHLKTLSESVISETWAKGSTVVGNDGFYVILKGLARPQTKVPENLIKENDSTVCSIPQSLQSFIFSDDLESAKLAEMLPPSRDSMLKQWSTFGSLEITPKIESETQEFSVVTEDDCEILKISAKEYAKLKLENIKLENLQKLKLIRKCPYYKEWPTLSIYELITVTKWKKFPPGHVIVESGDIISFVAYINSGYCNIYRSIIGLVKLQLNRVKKIQRLVCMGKLQEKESFGEISVLLQVPFTCTIITGNEVEMAIIEDKDLFGLDSVTKQLMLQTAKPTFGHLTEEDVKSEYLQNEQQKEWNSFKILFTS
ncbi:cyclic nucleotide-binding domain-containing protein 1 isoform X2 [Tupaia chinensis]|uniref:cyclic nucleotide-binding domain-containing protein 1 isoform X2 n=1 Tax=Tupaia chinensis TaxID=246437 RepID=UPI0003C8D48F|nr:cyclic nucleotide-binding domain-containing protein 1 isoform X2 [Tupaia chinensis]